MGIKIEKAPKLKLNLPGPIIVFDTETGGLNPSEEISWTLNNSNYYVGECIQGVINKLPAPILEIGAIALDPCSLEKIGEFHVLCGKESDETFDEFIARCSSEALKINGFISRLGELEAANPTSISLKSFGDWIKQIEEKYNYCKSIPCGQNIKFDIEMIKAACKRFGINYPINHHPLELISYSQLYFALPDTPTVANYKLSTIAEALGIPIKNAHQALADVQMTAQCIRTIFKRFCN